MGECGVPEEIAVVHHIHAFDDRRRSHDGVVVEGLGCRQDIFP